MVWRQIVSLWLLCLIAAGCNSSREKVAGADVCTSTDSSDTVSPDSAAANLAAWPAAIAGDTPGSFGFLQTRNSIIRLEAGPRFSLFELGGHPIALSLSKAEFRETFPRLYRAYESAVAESQTGSVTIDASTNVPQIEVFK